MEYCEACNELGEAGITCDYCTKIHTPSVAMVNTIKEIDNHHKGIEDNISPDSSHTTLDRRTALAEQGEETNFEFPPSDDDYDMSTVITNMTYQNQDGQ